MRFDKNEGIVVDTHVIRLSQRLGLTKQKDPEKIELDLMKLVPREHWTDWSHWLIWHGRRRCYARKPDCSRCEVFRLCPSGKVFLRTGQAQKPEAKLTSLFFQRDFADCACEIASRCALLFSVAAEIVLRVFSSPRRKALRDRPVRFARL